MERSNKTSAYNYPNKKPQEVTEEIESKVQAKKRILEVLEMEAAIVDEEIIEQVEARDFIIDEQNKEIVYLKMQLKSLTGSETDKQDEINALKDRVEDLIAEKSEIEENYALVQDEKKQILQEKEDLERAQEGLMEEQDLLRGEKELKDEEIKQLTDDIKQLSVIIRSMSDLNKDLTQKVDKLNADIEANLMAFYEAKVKVSNAEELEKNLLECIENSKKIEEKNKVLREKAKNLNKTNENLCILGKASQEKIAAFITDEIGDALKASLVDISKQLEKFSVKNEIDLKSGEDSEDMIMNLERESKEKDRQIAELMSKEKGLIEEIDNLKLLMEKKGKEHEETVSRLNTGLAPSIEANEKLNLQLREVQAKLGKKRNQYKFLQAKLLTIESKYSQKLINARAQKEKIEASNEELKEKYSKLRPQVSKLQSEMKEQKRLANQYSATIQVLHDEFWKKDTNLVKIKKNLIHSQKEIKTIKIALEKAESHTNHLVEQQANKSAKEISAKDQQIALLKGMLKGSINEPKQRDLSLQRHTHRISYDESAVNTSTATSERESRSFTNLTPSMIISNFLKLAALYKTKQEGQTTSRPNVSKLLTNLRRKLERFPSISSKELSANIPELKATIDAGKTQLSIDEVMTAITSTVN